MNNLPAPGLPRGTVVARLLNAASMLAFLFVHHATSAAVSAPQLQINANNIQVRQASGQMQYTGRVSIRHGNLKISGDRALVSVDNSGEKSVRIWGKPVRVDFNRRDGSPVKLSCEELTYTSALRQLTARDSATLSSSEGTLSGGQLDYSLNKETFSLAGTASQPRVNAVLAVTTPDTTGDSPR